MNIKRITINGLFNTFNHEVHFNEGGIAIMIGENGLGKTTILKIIDSIFNDKELQYLFTIDFESIVLSFKTYTWIIQKKEENEFPVIIISSSKQNEGDYYVMKASKDNRDMLFRNRFLKKSGDGSWFDRRRGVTLTTEDVKKIYGFDPSYLEHIETPEWYENAINKNHIHFIQTQRLYDFDSTKELHGEEIVQTVKTFSNRLVKLIKDYNTKFALNTIYLENTFPFRLIKGLSNNESVNDVLKDITDKIKVLNEYRSFLHEVGLVSKPQDDSLRKLFDALNNSPQAISIIKLYIDDSYSKLEVFNDLAQKLSTLLTIINSRFKHKALSIDKDNGLVIESKFTGDPIPIEKLSSGEQNEIVMFYGLLFNTDNKDIVLIDEPEISLHLKWQQRLIEDFQSICNSNHLSLLLATHSPDIIGSNWDLVQELKGKE